MDSVHVGSSEEISCMSKDVELSSVSISDDSNVFRAIQELRRSNGLSESTSLVVSADSSATLSPRSTSYSKQRLRFKASPKSVPGMSEVHCHSAGGCYTHSLPCTHWDIGKCTPVCYKCRNDGSIELVFSKLVKESHADFLGAIEEAIARLEAVLRDIRQSQTTFTREAQYVRRLIQEELSGWIERVDEEENLMKKSVVESVKSICERKKRLGEILRDLIGAENLSKPEDMVDFIRARPSMADAVSVLGDQIEAPWVDRSRIDRIKSEWMGREEKLYTPEQPVGRTKHGIVSEYSSLVELDRELRKEGKLSESEIEEMLVFFELNKT